MSKTAPTISDKIEPLEKFNRRVRKIEQGNFFERVQRPWGVNMVTNTVEANQSGYAWRLESDGPSDSDITAFATDFGFFDKGRDDINIYDISKLYTFLFANSCILQDMLDVFRARRDSLVAYWNTPSPVCATDFSKDFVGPDGQPLIGEDGQPVKGLIRQLTAGEVMTIFLYGYYLHENRGEERVLRKWRESDQVYPMLLIIFLHFLSRSAFTIQEIAEINTRVIEHLKTLNPAKQLQRSGVDPNPGVRMASMDSDFLDLLSQTAPAIMAPLVSQADGLYTFDF